MLDTTGNWTPTKRWDVERKRLVVVEKIQICAMFMNVHLSCCIKNGHRMRWRLAELSGNFPAKVLRRYPIGKMMISWT